MVWSTLSRGGWNPWQDIERLHAEMSRLLARAGDGPEGSANGYGGESLAVNLWTNAEGALLTAALPGFDPEQIDVTVVDDVVSLRGERRPEECGDDVAYHRQERAAGVRFARDVRLPFAIDSDGVRARFKNGVLEVELPRAASDRPRKIEIKSS